MFKIFLISLKIVKMYCFYLFQKNFTNMFSAVNQYDIKYKKKAFKLDNKCLN